MSEDTGKLDRNADYVARGMSTEVIAALRSHERMDELQFKQMSQQTEEIKNLIEDGKKELVEQIEALKREMHTGFTSYDKKFWSLAITIISTLLVICGFLIVYTLFPGHH